MATTFTEEQLATMSYQERVNAQELMELEAQLAAEQGMTVPPSEPVPVKDASAVPIIQANSPEELAAKTEEKSIPEVPAPEPAEVKTEPEPWEAEVDKLRKEAEMWKNRKADFDRTVGPLQQKVAQFKKELPSLENEAQEIKNLVSSLKEEIASLKQQVLEKTSGPEPELDEAYLSENYPDLAPRILAVKKAADQRYEEAMKQIEEVRNQTQQSRKQAEEEQYKQYCQNHYNAVKSQIPDLDDFLDDNKLGTPLAAWCMKQPDYVQEVRQNPVAYSPAALVDVINRFKASVGMNHKSTVKKPSLGDIATRAVSSPQAPVLPDEPEYLTDEEFKNIDALMTSNAKNPAKLEELVARFERTAIKKSTQT